MAYKYTLGGVDLESIGVLVESGSADFLKLPDMKDPYKYEWPDKNGVDVDLDNPVFKEKEITLNLAIVAYSEDEFWRNYNAFLNLIKTPGTKRMYVGDLGRSFFVYYNKMNSFTKLSPISGTSKIGAKYSVTFNEPIPSMLKPFAFLTTKEGRPITTSKTNNLINVA
ncbi:hypothetical protein ACJVDH_00440 [Pedobacter sp. AW1-32]|uniref:hypothetical protein n=1 Tax=Pedobacter sp. AW1-32 TaxID=3383026 RepID=UPI003FEFBA5D